jgi:hypothetical protein
VRNASPYGAGGLVSRKPEKNKGIKKPIHHIPYCAVGAFLKSLTPFIHIL